ncbi:hypothetical protein DIPPA_22705 [Diplonema papillatum]|nr:hypothetical protein DIPPA_22705 [Diplonema papillatum]
MASNSYMEKLVQDADVRFEEKFDAAKRGDPVNVSSQYSDRTYSLRAQVQGQPMLEKDAHLLTMVENIERYTLSESALRGDTDRKLTFTVATLLKSLLREVLGNTDSGVCKINIELAWRWYKDKSRDILQWKLCKMAATEQGRQDQVLKGTASIRKHANGGSPTWALGTRDPGGLRMGRQRLQGGDDGGREKGGRRSDESSSVSSSQEDTRSSGGSSAGPSEEAKIIGKLHRRKDARVRDNVDCEGSSGGDDDDDEYDNDNPPEPKDPGKGYSHNHQQPQLDNDEFGGGGGAAAVRRFSPARRGNRSHNNHSGRRRSRPRKHGGGGGGGGSLGAPQRRPFVNTVLRAHQAPKLDFMRTAAAAEVKTGVSKALAQSLANATATLAANKAARAARGGALLVNGDLVVPTDVVGVAEPVPSLATATLAANKAARAARGGALLVNGDLVVPTDVVASSTLQPEGKSGKCDLGDAPPEAKPQRSLLDKFRPKVYHAPAPPPPTPPPAAYPKIVYKANPVGHPSARGPPTLLHGNHAVPADAGFRERDASRLKEMLSVDKDSALWRRVQEAYAQVGVGAIEKAEDDEPQGGEAADDIRILEQAVANTQKRWVAGRAVEAAGGVEQRELNDARVMWQYNNARVLEEIHRRQESSMAGSQTGRSHHLILTSRRRPSTALSRWAQAPRAGQPPPSVPPSGRAGTPEVHSVLANGMVNQSLSASDHCMPSASEKIARDAERLAAMRKTPDDCVRATLKKAGTPDVHSVLANGMVNQSLSASDHCMPSASEKIARDAERLAAMRKTPDGCVRATFKKCAPTACGPATFFFFF